MKKIFWVGLLSVVLAIQLFRPDRSVPAVDPAQDIQKVMPMPAEVQTILNGACYDCHSYATQYPWYSQIAPVSWWLSNHIREGREHLNFSTFGSLAIEDRKEALEEAAEAIQEAEMPLASYTWTHPEARLSAVQRKTLVDWLNANGAASTMETEKDEKE